MHAKPVESFRLRKIADQSASTTEQTSIGPRQSPQRGESGCAGRRSHSELDCSRGTPLEACGAELPQERYEIDPKQHGTQAPHKNAPRPTHPHTHTSTHTIIKGTWIPLSRRAMLTPSQRTLVSKIYRSTSSEREPKVSTNSDTHENAKARTGYRSRPATPPLCKQAPGSFQ